MKSFIPLSKILQAEVYKTLRNRRIVTLLLSPLVFYLLILLYAIYKGRTGLLDATAFAYDANPWLMIWSRYTLPLLSLVLPPAIVILSYMVCELEFQNDNIRTLFALPIVKWKLYLSKVLSLSLLTAILCLVTWLGFILGGYLLGLLIPAYKFTDYSIWIGSIQLLGRILLASLSVGALGLIVSLLTRSFTLPILLGFFLTAFAVFITNEPSGAYLSFATFTYLASIRPVEELTSFALRDVVNLLSWGIALVIGYRCFTPEKKQLWGKH